jgi:gluconolactonase
MNEITATAIWAACVCATATGGEWKQGRIERFDPALDALVASDARIEHLASGFTWSEGPVWFDGAVVFSDVPRNTAYRWAEGMDAAEVFLRPSGMLDPVPGFREPGSNGLAVDSAGRLLLCQHGERRVARLVDGEFETIADRFDGKRFNSPNDLAVRRDGVIYFTDPPYGLEGVNDSPLREIDFHGIYRVDTEGRVVALVRDVAYPNGIAFSPDERRLYVGVSDGPRARVLVYDVGADGGLTNGRTFFDPAPYRSAGMHGSCDGLKVDREGNVWATGPGGVFVLSPEGKPLGRIVTGKATANCGFGGTDGSVLYVTAGDVLLRIQTLTTGAGRR